MSWILVSGAIICCWAMLRTMGGERERRVVEQRSANAPSLPAPAPPKPARKPSPKWGRQAA